MSYSEELERMMDHERASNTMSHMLGLKSNLLIKAEEENNKELIEKLKHELKILAEERNSMSDPEVRKKINTVYAAEVQQLLNLKK